MKTNYEVIKELSIDEMAVLFARMDDMNEFEMIAPLWKEWLEQPDVIRSEPSMVNPKDFVWKNTNKD